MNIDFYLEYMKEYDFYYFIIKELNDKIEALEKEKETILDYVESLNEELKALKAEKGGK